MKAQKADNDIIALRKAGFSFGEIADILREKGINLRIDSINRRYLQLEKEGLTAAVPAAVADRTTGKVSFEELSTISPKLSITEQELRQKHDMFFNILKRVKEISKGWFIEENKLLKELSYQGKPRYKDALAKEELKPYRGKVDGTTYYGHPDSIAKLKQEGVLS
jgi:hypothetical protein